MSKTKSNPIKSGSKDQGFLFEYFESKKWVILPTKNNEDRKDLMKERGWSKRQLATFRVVFFLQAFDKANTSTLRQILKDVTLKKIWHFPDPPREPFDAATFLRGYGASVVLHLHCLTFYRRIGRFSLRPVSQRGL
jgi:hypothetical protein